MSETDQLNQLISLAESSNKNDRRSAAEGLGNLNYAYPQAIATLERLKGDKDRRTKSNADKALNKLMKRDPPPTGSDGYSEEVGDSDLKPGEVDHESSMTDAEEDRAEEEAAGKGLGVKVIELNNVVIDPKGKFVSREQGTGSIVVKNTGSQNRIYGIDMFLDNLSGVKPMEGEEELADQIVVGELNPKEKWEKGYTFETEEAPISAKVSYLDPATNLLPNFRNSAENPVDFITTIEITNTTDQPLKNVEVRKTVGEYGTPKGNNTTMGNGKVEDKTVIFSIEELPAGETATMTVEISGSLPEGVESYETGNLEIIYRQPDVLFSGLEYKSIDGISDLKQSLKRREREEEPGVFDCELHLENVSEFVYEMLSLKVMAGSISGEETPIIDWDGTAVSEDERELVPGEKNDFEFVYETDEGTPTFGRTLNFTVQSFVEKYTQTALTVPPENLKFLSVGIAKDYILKKAPSYRETVVPTVVKVKGIGTYPLEALEITDSVPEGFSDIKEEAIEVYYNGQRLTEGFSISGNALGDGPDMPDSVNWSEAGEPEKVETKEPLDEGEAEGYEAAEESEDTAKEGDFSTSQEEVNLASRTFTVKFEHMEENELFKVGEGEDALAGLKENDIIEVRYPVTLLRPAKDSPPQKAPCKVEAWIYDAEDQKIVAGTEDEIVGIEIVHERIDVEISKMNQGIVVDGKNAYRITIEGVNEGSATVTFTLKDIIPKGFSIVGETVEEPAVSSEKGSETEVGEERVWTFENIEPNATVKVVYTIAGEEGAVYNPRDALIVAQG